jgi:type VI secretion system secreted protein VgrG
MPDYTQENRLISISTPLGKDIFLLQRFTGSEGISRLFNFRLSLLSTQSSIDFTKIIGQNVTVSIELGDGTQRYFNGHISRFGQAGSDERFFHYEAEMAPWLWFLTRNADCRIYQNLAVPDIIQQVFQNHGFNAFSSSLTGSYSAREYCVQYRETDFNFVSRLMEEYGIFYFFEHENGKHTLVLGDSTSAYLTASPHTVSYAHTPGGLSDEDVVLDWKIEQEVRTGKYTHTDYNFTTPSANLRAQEPTIVQAGDNAKLEIYDYPGEYATSDDGAFLAKVRMQEHEATCIVHSGSSNCRTFTSGYSFSLEEHYRDDINSDFLLIELFHDATAGRAYAPGGVGQAEEGDETYTNRFVCIPKGVLFRPPRLTPRPYIRGPQTAVVVGPSGNEIYVDQYGRVKVQFFWDRLGKNDENSSCWIRVSHPWAGQGWGSIWIPRVGHEVIVEFLEGDPDQPIITGRVYNANQTVPYELPDHMTRSTLQSRSTKEGGAPNYNELRFEDKKGAEQMFINAERDMDWRVENDSREFVGANRHLIVTTDQHELVQGKKHAHVKGDHLEKIEGAKSLQVTGNVMEKFGGSQSLQVGGDYKEKIGGGMSIQVSGDRNEKVEGGLSLQVGLSRNEKVGMTHAMEAGQTIHLKGGMTVVIEGGMEVCLKGPGGFVSVGPAGVAIQGTMVLINSGGAAASGPGASPQSPSDPDNPADPADPDTADDGSKGTKLNS